MTSETHDIMHDTIRLERALPFPPSTVFAAYADVEQRTTWTTPSDDEIIIFEADDFQVGGIDQFLCGPRAAPDFLGTTRYDAIVDDELIVFTERLVYGEQLLAMSLITWEIKPSPSGTTLVVTDQVTSLAGQGPIDGSRDGYNAVLDRLGRYLTGDLEARS